MTDLQHKALINIVIYSCFVHLVLFGTAAYLCHSIRQELINYPSVQDYGGIYDAMVSMADLTIFYIVSAAYCIGLFIFSLVVIWRTREPYIFALAQFACFKTILHLCSIKALYSIIVFWVEFSADDDELLSPSINVEKIRVLFDLFFSIEIMPIIVSAIFVVKGLMLFSRELIQMNSRRLLPLVLQQDPYRYTGLGQ